MNFSHCIRPLGLLLALSGTLGAQVSGPPRVVTTHPANNAADVSVDLKEIVVTFDQDMDRNGYSFVGGGPSFPKVIGKPSWRTARECVLPVQLMPGQSYTIGINGPRHGNFKSTQGVPATPFTLKFGTGGSSSSSPASQGEAVRRLREAVNQHYSYRETHVIDWPAAWQRTEPRLLAATSARQFAETAGEMLAATRDPHIWLDAGGMLVPAFQRRVVPNVAPKLLPGLIDQWTPVNPVVATGWVAPGVAYLAIHSWERKHGREIYEAAFAALAAFQSAPALIIDVRLNSGGDELIAREFAGCFVTRRVLYARHVNRDPNAPGGFSPPFERWLEPNAARPHYGGKIAVLTGPVNMSSAEAFLLMMKQAPKAVLVGQRSYGSSGHPKPHDLGNGVTVFLPSWKAQTPEGAEVEGKGIAPDLEVAFDSNDEELKRDAALKAAVVRLTGQ